MKDKYNRLTMAKKFNAIKGKEKNIYTFIYKFHKINFNIHRTHLEILHIKELLIYKVDLDMSENDLGRNKECRSKFTMKRKERIFQMKTFYISYRTKIMSQMNICKYYIYFIYYMYV